MWKNAGYPDRRKPVNADIAVTTKARHPYSVVEIVSANGKDKFVSYFEEKPYLSSPTWIGIAVINMGFLRNFVYNDLQLQNAHGLDFGRDIWGQMGQRYAVFVYENNHKEWYDIGTIHGYLAIREMLKPKREEMVYNVV
jgi:ADP-glucose pyrophosphorylase